MTSNCHKLSEEGERIILCLWCLLTSVLSCMLSSLGGYEAYMGEKAGGLCRWGDPIADRICWCADSPLETHMALEERSALMRIQGLV